jgi:hypothetical protein
MNAWAEMWDGIFSGKIIGVPTGFEPVVTAVKEFAGKLLKLRNADGYQERFQ